MPRLWIQAGVASMKKIPQINKYHSIMHCLTLRCVIKVILGLICHENDKISFSMLQIGVDFVPSKVGVVKKNCNGQWHEFAWCWLRETLQIVKQLIDATNLLSLHQLKKLKLYFLNNVSPMTTQLKSWNRRAQSYWLLISLRKLWAFWVR